jgi:uncharacterized membrane protein YjgN (DUF898 family)
METVSEANVSVENFSFDGKFGEYFRIWIVNTSLSILTLGVYSAWATVRNRKYLYRSTRLAGSGFDFHASPMAILKGRSIAVFIVAVYLGISFLLAGAEISVALAITLCLPWLIVRSRMFRLWNTSYRNIRFSFAPVVGAAVRVMLGIGLLIGLSLGLAYPYYKYRRADLIVSNSRFGNLPFALNKLTSGFYWRYLGAGLALIAGSLILSSIYDFSAISDVINAGQDAVEKTVMEDIEDLPESEPTDEDGMPKIDSAMLASIGGIVFGYILIYMVVATYLGASILKLVLNNTSVGKHRLRCNWSVWRLVCIRLSNFVLVIFSLGLLAPLATIRMQRYQLNNLAIEVHGDLDEIVSGEGLQVSAIGDELGGAFDFDLGL